jgi:hypothetical protein
LVDAPKGSNIIGCRWVYAIKRDAAGNIVRYKARLVAQGFSQVSGVDFFDTYAPVAKMASIRTVLALSAQYDYEIHQVDIKNAFLNGEFLENEAIYMKLPQGVKLTDEKGKVLELHPNHTPWTRLHGETIRPSIFRVLTTFQSQSRPQETATR